MLLHRRPTPDLFHYDKPVILLIDSGCFSAADIFAGAFHGWRDVTLMGTLTGGGSGRARSYRLFHSNLEARLSSMVSYRPDGSLYDGLAISPDIVVCPTAQDVLGKTDTVLEAARRRLVGQK